jgi:hypothetical membrane protein
VLALRAAQVSSALAPVALFGGFEIAAARQSAAYSPVRDTISALAARGVTDRWIMTCAFVVLGLCHVVTAYGLRRPVLAVGGAATALLAIAPQPAHGSSELHVALAGVALIALALWPVQDGRQGRWAAAVLVVVLVWFAVALQSGTAVGLAERVLTGAEALWPIVAVRTALQSVRFPA